MAANAPVPTQDLAAQLAAMDKAAESSLSSRIYTVDGLDVTAWIDVQPVVIKVPIFDENHQWQGDSRYYYKQGRLFAVNMPYGRYQFDGRGNMTLWLDETGVQTELPGSTAWGRRQDWLLKRATQLAVAFAPSSNEQRLQSPDSKLHLQGDKKVEYLCTGQLYTLTRAQKLQPAAQGIKIEGLKMSGSMQAGFADSWQPLAFTCQVDAADHVILLTYRFVAPISSEK
jgi:hypothetical protein